MIMRKLKKEFSPKQREELLRALKARFEKNMNLHKGLEWAKVQAKLEAKLLLPIMTMFDILVMSNRTRYAFP